MKALILEQALAAGFDGVGIAAASRRAPAADRLVRFVALGRHGEMSWMAATLERRCDPQRLWPEARSAIMLAKSYAPAHDPLADLARPERGVVSVYAQGRDYHDIVKPALKRLAQSIVAASGAETKVFVDTAPLLEKPLAAAAGLGWQGKHTNLVSRVHGSWLFLGAILTTLELAPDAAETDHCGSCRRCLDVCPTDAFPAPYQLDARRCISYLTIEHKGQIGREFRRPIGNRVFGCDDCLAVCPWNKFAQAARDTRLAGSPQTRNPPLSELLAMDDQTFRARFAGTPVKRTGRDRIVRNALIAAGNAGREELAGPVLRLTRDGSALVRGMAAWALGRIVGSDRLAWHRAEALSGETDPEVRDEWMNAGLEP